MRLLISTQIDYSLRNDKSNIKLKSTNVPTSYLGFTL